MKGLDAAGARMRRAGTGKPFRRGVIAVCATLALAQNSGAQPAAISLAWAEGKPAQWRGISPEEPPGQVGNPTLYPASNAAGLVGSILGHVLAVQGIRAAERKASQASSDKVLTPHESAVAAVAQDGWLDLVSGELPANAAGSPHGAQVLMRAQFGLSLDRRVLVLDNALLVSEPGGDPTKPSSVRFNNTVRVISAPRTEEDPLAYWTADDGRTLRQEAVLMVAHSIEVALSQLAPPDAQAQRTQRYLYGAQLRMERGQPVASSCARVVLRTLRDTFISVPKPPAENAPGEASPCERPYALLPR